MDTKRHAHVYDELLKISLILDFNDVPTPAYIQQKIIECSTYQLKVEKFYIEVTRELANAQKAFGIEKLNLSMLRNNMLTNNEKVKNLPTGKEREAAVDEILENNHKNLLKLQNDVNDLTSVLSAIKQKQVTLKNNNYDIKSLLKLMEQQINQLNIGHPDDPDVKELANSFSEIDKMEEEFELEDVESSVDDDLQSEDSDDILNPEESEDSIVIDEAVEKISTEDFDSIEETNVLGNEPDPDKPNKAVIQENGGQSTEDFMRSFNSDIDDEIASYQNEDTSDSNFEDEINSFLTEEASGKNKPEEESRDRKEITNNSLNKIEETIVEGSESKDSSLDFDNELSSFLINDDSDLNHSEVVDDDDEIDDGVIEDVTKGSEKESTENSKSEVSTPDENTNMDIEIESDVETKEIKAPLVEVDLYDIGIDIGDDIISKHSESPPNTNKKPSTNKSDGVKAKVKKEDPISEEKKVEKKKEPPVQKPQAETKKADTTDIDLNEILNSLD